MKELGSNNMKEGGEYGKASRKERGEGWRGKKAAGKKGKGRRRGEEQQGLQGQRE